MLLDGERFYFPRVFYSFNKGCVYGLKYRRPWYHILFDMWLNEWTFENFSICVLNLMQV